MLSSFPRLLTLLRKERGISQKEAAAELQVSQALLSHYEKGIRQCGLDFVVRAADFYGVSCDYLLGRTADKSGAMILVDDIPDSENAGGDQKLRGSVLPVLNKKLLFNSINVLFDLLQRCNHKELTAEVSDYLTLAVYVMFRSLYSANPKNPAALFSAPDYLYRADAAGKMVRLAAQVNHLASGGKVADEEGLSPENAPAVLPDTLQKEYPMFASSLLNLLRKAEGLLDDE